MGIFSKRRRRRRNESVLGRLSFFRWLGPGATTVGILGVAYMALTGQWDLSLLDTLRDPTADTLRLDPITLGDRPKDPEKIRIATFNIKVFGEAKSSSQSIMENLAQVVTRFDVIAIQEIRATDGKGTPVRRLINLINDSGGRFAATMSDPVGSPDYKECYAFLWDETRIRYVADSAYVVQDTDKRIDREPMVASFETRVGPESTRQPFRFTMINAHTKPSAVNPDSPDGEINVLDDVLIRVGNYESQIAGEDDFILLGDLNVDLANLGDLAQIPNLHSVAGDTPTNTVKSATYDHILVDQRATQEYTRAYGVFDLESQLGLTREQAIEISDHLPVWAEFSLYEAPLPTAQVANQSTEVIR